MHCPSTKPSSGKGLTGGLRALAAVCLAASSSTFAACPDGATRCVENALLPAPSGAIPVFAQTKALAHRIALAEIGSYHQRRGEQREWIGGGSQNWLRLHHEDTRLDIEGEAYSRFDGHLSGFQLGGNIYSAPSCRGSQEIGLLAGSSRVSGDVSGKSSRAGHNELRSHHIGGYFTDYNLDQSYLDLMFRVAYLQLDSRPTGEDRGRTHGTQISLSAEKGFILQLANDLNLEPQLQVLANYTNLTPYSKAKIDQTPELTFRAGLRGYSTESGRRYYLYGNLWHTLGGGDEFLLSSGTHLKTERRATWMEIGGGLQLLQTRNITARMNLGYQHSIDDLDRRFLNANLGFNWAW